MKSIIKANESLKKSPFFLIAIGLIILVLLIRLNLIAIDPVAFILIFFLMRQASTSLHTFFRRVRKFTDQNPTVNLDKHKGANLKNSMNKNLTFSDKYIRHYLKISGCCDESYGHCSVDFHYLNSPKKGVFDVIVKCNLCDLNKYILLRIYREGGIKINEFEEMLLKFYTPNDLCIAVPFKTDIEKMSRYKVIELSDDNSFPKQYTPPELFKIRAKFWQLSIPPELLNDYKSCKRSWRQKIDELQLGNIYNFSSNDDSRKAARWLVENLEQIIHILDRLPLVIDNKFVQNKNIVNIKNCHNCKPKIISWHDWELEPIGYSLNPNIFQNKENVNIISETLRCRGFDQTSILDVKFASYFGEYEKSISSGNFLDSVNIANKIYKDFSNENINMYSS